MWSLRLIASPVPATRFSGCTTGAPSQADVDCAEPQEVLVSKEDLAKKPESAKKPACSLVDNVSLGLQLPPSGSGCLALDGDGPQPASSVQSFVLCAVVVVS